MALLQQYHLRVTRNAGYYVTYHNQSPTGDDTVDSTKVEKWNFLDCTVDEVLTDTILCIQQT